MKKKWPILFVFVFVFSALLCGLVSVSVNSNLSQKIEQDIDEKVSATASGHWDDYAASRFSESRTEYDRKTGESYTLVFIHSANELALLSKNSWQIASNSSRVARYLYLYKIYLTCDLDMSAHYWRPISWLSEGFFDGQGYTISGITTIIQDDMMQNYSVGSETPKNFYGLFSTIADYFEVKNLNVGVDITSNVTNSKAVHYIIPTIGGIVGRIYGMDCSIKNCSAFGKITCPSNYYIDDVGGICGVSIEGGVSETDYDEVEAIIDNCVSYVNIDCGGGSYEVSSSIGGILGAITKKASTHVSNCLVVAEYVHGPFTVSGIVGYMNNTYDTFVEDCVNYATVGSRTRYYDDHGITREWTSTHLRNCASYHYGSLIKYNLNDGSADEYVGDLCNSTLTSIIKRRYRTDLYENMTYVPTSLLRDFTITLDYEKDGAYEACTDNSIAYFSYYDDTGVHEGYQFDYYYLPGEEFNKWLRDDGGDRYEIRLVVRNTNFFSGIYSHSSQYNEDTGEDPSNFSYSSSLSRLVSKSARLKGGLYNDYTLILESKTGTFTIETDAHCSASGETNNKLFISAKYGERISATITADTHYQIKSQALEPGMSWDGTTFTLSSWTTQSSRVKFTSSEREYSAKITLKVEDVSGDKQYGPVESKFKLSSKSVEFVFDNVKFDNAYNYTWTNGSFDKNVQMNVTEGAGTETGTKKITIKNNNMFDYLDNLELTYTITRSPKVISVVLINQSVGDDNSPKYFSFSKVSIKVNDVTKEYTTTGEKTDIQFKTGDKVSFDSVAKAGFSQTSYEITDQSSERYDFVPEPKEKPETKEKFRVQVYDESATVTVRFYFEKDKFTLDLEDLTSEQMSNKNASYHTKITVSVKTENVGRKDFLGIYRKVDDNSQNDQLLTLEESYSFIVDPSQTGQNIEKLRLVAKYSGAMDANSTPPTLNGKYYSVASKENLIWLSQQVSDGNTFAGYVFKQTADIDFSGSKFNPIGDETHAFSGTYDGQNHYISGISFVNSSDRVQVGFVGFFGKVHNATIKNLVIKNTNVEGYRYVGLFAGKATNSTFYNLVAEGCSVKTSSLTFYNVFGEQVSAASITYTYNVFGEQVSAASITYTDSIVYTSVAGDYTNSSNIYTKNRENFAGAVGNASGCAFTGVGINAEIINEDKILQKAFNGSGQSTYSKCFVEGEVLQEIVSFGDGTVSDCYYRNAKRKTVEGNQVYSWYSGDINPSTNANYFELNGKYFLKFFYWAV